MATMLEFPTQEELALMMQAPWAPYMVQPTDVIGAPETDTVAELTEDEMVREIYLMMIDLTRKEAAEEDNGGIIGTIDHGAILMGNVNQP